MRIEQTSGTGRAPRVAVDRPATMRDPTRAPIDVIVENVSETGALLRSAGALPVGTLISLGIAGAGLLLARVVRTLPETMAIEFMLPLDPAAVARAKSADTLVSVAFPQMSPLSGPDRPPVLDAPVRVPPATVSEAPDARTIDPRAAGVVQRSPTHAAGWHPVSLWLVGLAVAAVLLMLIVI